MGLFGKKTKPKQGAVKTVNGIHYAYRGGKWVKMSAQAQANINRNDALNRANVGGTTQLLKNQKAPSNRSSSSATTNTNNNKKEVPKGQPKPKVVSVGTVNFNINKDHSGTEAGLTSYNKAKKAAIGKKTDKERDKSTNKVLKEERESNRNKISANNKKKITARSRMRARNEEIHGKSMQPLIDKHAAWKKARKEGTLADWEKTHHPDRVPQYRNRKKLKGEKTTNSPLHKAGGPNSQFNKDGTPKTKKSTPNSVQQIKKKKKKVNHTGQPGGKYQFTTM